jgi:hypothetical protein
MHSGSCLCGAVTFRIEGEIAAPQACHCVTCRKQSGHYGAFARSLKANLVMTAAGGLTWFQSSEQVRRGFCSICGSTLFFDPTDQDWTSVAMGAFDGTTGAKLSVHIFVADKGDYYDIADGVPQKIDL